MGLKFIWVMSIIGTTNIPSFVKIQGVTLQFLVDLIWNDPLSKTIHFLILVLVIMQFTVSYLFSVIMEICAFKICLIFIVFFFFVSHYLKSFVCTLWLIYFKFGGQYKHNIACLQINHAVLNSSSAIISQITQCVVCYCTVKQFRSH